MDVSRETTSMHVYCRVRHYQWKLAERTQVVNLCIRCRVRAFFVCRIKGGKLAVETYATWISIALQVFSKIWPNTLNLLQLHWRSQVLGSLHWIKKGWLRCDHNCKWCKLTVSGLWSVICLQGWNSSLKLSVIRGKPLPLESHYEYWNICGMRLSQKSDPTVACKAEITWLECLLCLPCRGCIP